jgi:hypothetical protein
VPKAEIPKEHLRAIDKDHQVHDFQIVCSTQFSLSEVPLSVRAASQIARRLALREFIFIVIINDVALFTVISACIYKTRTEQLLGCNCHRLMRGIPRYVARIAPDRFSRTVRWPRDRVSRYIADIDL